jgi:hypothetical protein
MVLHAINQAALVKSSDNSGNSCNMRADNMNTDARPRSEWIENNREQSSLLR